MTNTEAKAALVAAYPRVKWVLGSEREWAIIYGTAPETLPFQVAPPDLEVDRPVWTCKVGAVLAKQRDGETVVQLVARAVHELKGVVVRTWEAVEVAP